jgi:cysteine-rich repeat protein
MSKPSHAVLAVAVLLSLLLPEPGFGQGCIDPPTGLRGWWTGDGTVADLSSAHDAALEGGAGYSSGQVGQAFALDGVDDWVSVADDPALDVGTGDWAVSLWVKFNSTSGEQILVEKLVSYYPGEGWTLTKRSDTILFSGLGGQTETGGLGLTTGTWYHVVARRAAGALAVFVNGTQMAAGTSFGDMSSSASLKFGHRGGPSDTPGSDDPRGFFLNGSIDEVMLFVGSAPSDAEIQAIYAAGSSGICVRPAVCANGTRELGEACDDGNLANGDGCDSDCTLTACGNGIATAGEQCDDGNGASGDGCEPDCKVTPVDQPVLAGGTVSTDHVGDGATASMPLQIALTSPNAGTVTIAPPATPQVPEGMEVLGFQLQIEAPDASVEDPLEIRLSVDASAIPPGIDPGRLDVTRDGVLIEDCSGAAGTASPDPCIESRTLLVDGDVEITVLTSHASLWGVVLRGLRRGEQDCVNGIAKATTAVAQAQSKLDAACLKAASKATQPGAAACVLADAAGKVGSRMQQTIALADDKCVPPPPFGFLDAPTVNATVQEVERGLLVDLLGNDFDAAIATDKGGAACQGSALKSLQKLFDAEAKSLVACLKAAVAGKTGLAVSATDLSRCYDFLTADSDGKIAKAFGKLAATISRRCGGNPVMLLPGACAMASDGAHCLGGRVDCRICTMFNGTAALVQDCDAFDDGVDNGTCD